MKPAKKLTDLDCKNATCPPDKKRHRLQVGASLYLEIAPSGSKRWFYKYVQDGKETRAALGSYPAVSLAQARKARDEAKLQRAQGIDPVQAKQLEKAKALTPAGSQFAAIAMDWYNKQAPTWSDSHASRVKVWLEKDLFPYIGSLPMERIEALQLLHALQRVEARGAIETAHRVLQVAGQIWDYWLPIAPVAQRNITEGLKARLKPYKKGKFPAITEPARFAELLRAMDEYNGGIVVKTALLLAPLLWQRPGNLRSMRWCDLDTEQRLWTIPSADMKRTKEEKEHGDDHVVTLPRQAVALLEALRPLTGRGVYVFPNERSQDRPASDNSVRTALYSLGFGKEQSWHGFRASARTMLVDELDLDPLAMEAHMAHAVKDANGRSYNRTNYLKKRIAMQQTWADYLDALKAGKPAGRVLYMPPRTA